MMEIKGKLFKKMPVQTGQGRNGEWKKQEIILEQEGTYPRKVCVAVWGDKLDIASIAEGTMLNVTVDVESREWNDKWYTDLKAWKIDVLDANQSPQSGSGDYPPPPPPPPSFESGQPDDLPF
ncbi:MAG: DUF3127 domain-containing protein [Bacteroidales bacterium]|jgi:hypothetical protein|nr:DUF3127 domain-containing protein [Bacteroidales bacterium]